MERYIYFCGFGSVSSVQKEYILELNKVLSNVGVEFSVKNVPNSDFFDINVNVDIDTFEEYKIKNAGRPVTVPNKIVTVKSVRERMKKETAEQIASDLGISRSTLFRRLKNAKLQGSEFL